jgi:hypothetical protein
MWGKMSLELYEDQAESLIESAQVEPEQVRSGTKSWPLPRLKPSGRYEPQDLRLIHLSNRFVEAVFCPDLGGRLIKLIDRRSGKDLISMGDKVRLADGDSRGVRLEAGLELGLDGIERPTSLARVQTMLHEPNGETEPAAVILHEVIPGLNLSWHACWTLHPDRAQLMLEIKLLNRGHTSLPIDPCLLAHGLAAEGSKLLSDENSGLWVERDNSPVKSKDGAVHLLPEGSEIAPFQSVDLKLWLTPFSGFVPEEGSEHGLIGVTESSVTIQAAAPIKARIEVLTSADERLQAETDLKPDQPTEIPLAGHSPKSIIVSGDTKGQEILWPQKMASTSAPEAELAAIAAAAEGWQNARPLAASTTAGTRHTAAIAEALRLSRLREFKKADAHLESALMWAGESPLIWHLKAAVRRNGTLDKADDECPELLNAHFLAPLEPRLRAENYLRQSQAQSSDPNPLMRPLAADPDAALDVICAYTAAGLYSDALRIADELIRHKENPLIRIMMAWMLLKGSPMEMEAAGHLQKAESLGFEPPYPWRAQEIKAIDDLLEWQPDGAMLIRYQSMLEA